MKGEKLAIKGTLPSLCVVPWRLTTYKQVLGSWSAKPVRIIRLVMISDE